MLPTNKNTQSNVESFILKPSQAVMLIGPTGSGTYPLAQYIRNKVFENYGISSNGSDAYSKVITSINSKSIGIAEMLELEKFLYLKVPLRSAVNRFVIIKDAHLLTLEAQNALLKTLEEPPAGTVILLASESQRSLLSTVQSRLQTIYIGRPEIAEIRSYFINQGHSEKDVQNALKVSGGLPELTDSILNEKQHPLLPATAIVREMLTKTTFERLCMVDVISKDRELCINIMMIFQQMAHVSLLNGGLKQRIWSKIFTESIKAKESLELNAQPKITITNFILSV